MSHPQQRMTDTFSRPLRDLRISLTDRCNFRCRYCMPKEVFGPDYKFLPQEAVMTVDEILRLTRILAEMGVQKVRLTGGEPLLRRDLVDIVAGLQEIPGFEDIALTTNGSLLTERRAKQLAAAGLKRITISLDALHNGTFQRMNDVGFPVQRVLRAIEMAQAAHLQPVKINMVVKRGVNDDQILPMAEYFRGTGAILRFIEYMDVGTTNGWDWTDVIPAAEIHDRIAQVYPLVPLAPTIPGEVATRYAYADGQGEVGMISSVSKPFCTHCSRLRLTAAGELFTCLFAAKGMPLLAELRAGASDAALAERIAQRWRRRTDRYSMERSRETSKQARVEMSRIGG